MASSSVISFPQSVIGCSSGSSVLPTSTLRHRGLHLVPASTEPASTRSTSNRSNSQAQADRIVAQVEQEIAIRAFRQRQSQISGNAPATSTPANLYTLPIAETETAASVARRLFDALLSFARPA